tara:strand:- start:425 stop:691 length:267 start_codon:yes stop_codon:yes gene_type:complete
MTEESASILIDQLTLKDPEFIQVAITKLFEYPSFKTLKKTTNDKRAEIETATLVIISENFSPIFLPKNPAKIDANKGKNNIKYSILSF